MRLKNVRRSRKWLICRPQLFGWLGIGSAGGKQSSSPLDVAQKPAASRVEPPSDGNAAQVKDEEPPQCCLRPAGHTDRGAVALRDEECAVGRNRRGEADDCRAFLVSLTRAGGDVCSR